MSKITFRADDDLVRRIEALEASKSEVMREALRTYLEDASDVEADTESLDALITERIDRRIDDRLADQPAGPPDVNVNVTIEDDRVSAGRETTPEPEPAERPRSHADERSCDQCGERVDADHVYCPNCGEKAVNRLFCDCGDEVRSDWAFCPSCGRRTPAADVLE